MPIASNSSPQLGEPGRRYPPLDVRLGSDSIGHKTVGIGNGISVRADRPNSAWKASGVIGLSRSVMKTCAKTLCCAAGVAGTRAGEDCDAEFLNLRRHYDAVQVIGLAIELERGTDMKAKVRR